MLRAIFAEGGVTERVFFPGQVTRRDLPDYYRAADLYVSASHTDGTSVSLLEALSCGCPVLVSDIPGNREWVSPAVGWTFQTGDVPALAHGLADAVRERTRSPEMRLAARSLAESRADWKKNFLRLLDAYRMALECCRKEKGS
jgi:L-malate glycosyltransferase